MTNNKKNLGVCITGSFCTLSKTLELIKELKPEYNLFPIISYTVCNFDTRFYKKEDFRKDLYDICENTIYDSIVEAESIGPDNNLDAMLVLPCTGNTLSKIAQGITDTPATMAIKAHSRNLKPTIICLATNDGLSASMTNLSTIYNKKNFYIAPLLQDDPIKKPNSLVVDFSQIHHTLTQSLLGIQVQPIF